MGMLHEYAGWPDVYNDLAGIKAPEQELENPAEVIKTVEITNIQVSMLNDQATGNLRKELARCVCA